MDKMAPSTILARVTTLEESKAMIFVNLVIILGKSQEL